MVMAVTQLKVRHAELVSASIAPSQSEVSDEKWTLKQVQGDVGRELSLLIERFDAAVSDDLNTAIALTVLEEVVALKKADLGEKLTAIAAMDAVLGVGLLSLTRTDLRIKPSTAQLSEDHVDASIAFRRELRAQQNYPALDRNRDELAAKGVEVMDGDPLGWDWKLGG